MDSAYGSLSKPSSVFSDSFSFSTLTTLLQNRDDELVKDDRDTNTPDKWIERHPELIRLTGNLPY
jgi:hypothetical protein